MKRWWLLATMIVVGIAVALCVTAIITGNGMLAFFAAIVLLSAFMAALPKWERTQGHSMALEFFAWLILGHRRRLPGDRKHHKNEN